MILIILQFQLVQFLKMFTSYNLIALAGFLTNVTQICIFEIWFKHVNWLCIS
jgi:hypothetical protein